MKPASVLHEFCMGHVRATHETHTGHVRAHNGHRTVPHEWSYNCSEPLMPYAWPRMPRTMSLRAPYRSRKVLLLAFAIPWSNYRRHTNGSRRKPVDHVTTNIAESPKQKQFLMQISSNFDQHFYIIVVDTLYYVFLHKKATNISPKLYPDGPHLTLIFVGNGVVGGRAQFFPASPSLKRLL